MLFSINTFQQLRADQPKLVVLITLDQFPYEYLTRFQPYFSNGGFNYVLRNGASFANAQYEHSCPKTADGHAAIITGTYSHLNGITGNKWFDRKNKKVVNCVDDEATQLFGAAGVGRSPHNLQAYTVGDMLRLYTNFRSKVIGISNKDRSAILMAGKFGTAFWFDDSVVVTSSYYMSKAPAWLTSFNGSGAFQQYFGKQWKETLPGAAAPLCDDDDAPYEVDTFGLGRVFPHPIVGKDPQRITPSYYSALVCSPFATELLLNLAQNVVAQESLGVRGVTDMLCVGISATDEIGHSYGPQSHEVFDNALRTDEMLGQFFSYLEKTIGLNHCLIILTSDHGIAPIPEYLQKKSPHVEAGRVSSKEISNLADSLLEKTFGKTPSGSGWIARVIEGDIYLNMEVLKEKNISLREATHVLRDSLLGSSFVAATYTRDELEQTTPQDYFGKRMAKTFFSQRSGDVLLVLKPYYILMSETKGTNHGQPYEYDSHVPLIFVGKHFTPGVYLDEVSPIDLAPTLAEVLGLPFPPSCEGKVLRGAIK